MKKGTTQKSNIYISKQFHLKLIDDLGFNTGKDGEINEEIEKSNNKKHRIYIDQNSKLSLGYNNDSRNKTHVLLYFIRYDINSPSYCVTGGHLKYIKEIDKEGVPIIFVINFCDDKVFKDKKEIKEKKKKRKKRKG